MGICCNDPAHLDSVVNINDDLLLRVGGGWHICDRCHLSYCADWHWLLIDNNLLGSCSDLLGNKHGVGDCSEHQ